MSNLSELLPTGGGQNAVDFVATGTLASGQTVALKADGTVEAVTGVAEGVGTPSVFESAVTDQTASTFDSNFNKIVIAYRDDGNSNFGTAVVGTVSGTSISFGTAVAFGSALNIDFAATFDSNSNKVVIAYKDFGNSGYGTAIVGTVSGTSISFGTANILNSGNTIHIAATFDSSSNKVVIAYKNGGNSNYGEAVVGTVSGTSISFGTAGVFESAEINRVSVAFDSNVNKVVLAYQDVVNSSYGTAVVCTVSGTSISFGTAVVFESIASSSISATFDTTNSRVVIFYGQSQGAAGGYTPYGTAIVGTVSGTSISFGTAVQFNLAYTTYIAATYDSTSNKVVVSYKDGSTSPNNGRSRAGTVSGTTITFDSPVVFVSNDFYYTSITFDSANSKVVTAYRDNGNSSYGTSVVFTVGSTNNTSFIGITAEAISSGATGAINTYGGINTAQTGLTIASDYYVQADGSLSTTTSTAKAGQAISATTINLKDLT